YGGERHPFDPCQHRREIADRFFLHWREGEPAVPADYRGHTVKRAWRQVRIPRHLGVVVGVHVDEPRSDHLSCGIDPASGRLLEVADLYDPAVPDPHIRPAAGCPGPV